MGVGESSVQVIAVDMDGTFLRADGTYDRAHFTRLRSRLAAANTRFVIASGNQHQQLRGHFDNPDEFSYVAENGALVADQGEVLFTASLPAGQGREVLEALAAMPGLQYLACTPQGAFAPPNATDAFVETMRVYYPVLSRIDDLQVVADRLFKVGIGIAEGWTPELVAELRERTRGILEPVTSGHDSIDLIIPGIHKANGLRRLLERWDVQPSELVAFGDSANDLEMLRFAGRSYAMANATTEVKQAAGNVIGSNNDDAVLTTIEQLMDVRL